MTQTVVIEQEGFSPKKCSNTTVSGAGSVLVAAVAAVDALSAGDEATFSHALKILPDDVRDLPEAFTSVVVNVPKSGSAHELVPVTSLEEKYFQVDEYLKVFARVMLKLDVDDMDPKTIRNAFDSVKKDFVKANVDVRRGQEDINRIGELLLNNIKQGNINHNNNSSLQQFLSVIAGWIAKGTDSNSKEVLLSAFPVFAIAGHLYTKEGKVKEICERLRSRLSRNELEKHVGTSTIPDQLIRNVFGDTCDNIDAVVKDITKEFACGKSALAHILEQASPIASSSLHLFKGLSHCRALVETLIANKLECDKFDTRVKDIGSYCQKLAIRNGQTEQTFNSDGSIDWDCAVNMVNAHFGRLYGTLEWDSALWENRTELLTDLKETLTDLKDATSLSPSVDEQINKCLSQVDAELIEAKKWSRTLQDSWTSLKNYMPSLQKTPIPFVTLPVFLLALTDDIKRKHVVDYVKIFDRANWKKRLDELEGSNPIRQPALLANSMEVRQHFDEVAKQVEAMDNGSSSCSSKVPPSLTLVANSFDASRLGLSVQNDINKLLEIKELFEKSSDHFDSVTVLDIYSKSLGAYIEHFKTYEKVESELYKTLFKKEHLAYTGQLELARDATINKLTNDFQTAEEIIKQNKEAIAEVMDDSFVVIPKGSLTAVSQVSDWNKYLGNHVLFTGAPDYAEAHATGKEQISIALQLLRNDKNAAAKYAKEAAKIKEIAARLNRPNLQSYGLPTCEPEVNAQASSPSCPFEHVAKKSNNVLAHNSGSCSYCGNDKIHYHGETAADALKLQTHLREGVQSGPIDDRVHTISLFVEDHVKEMRNDIAHIDLATFKKMVEYAINLKLPTVAVQPATSMTSVVSNTP